MYPNRSFYVSYVIRNDGVMASKRSLNGGPWYCDDSKAYHWRILAVMIVTVNIQPRWLSIYWPRPGNVSGRMARLSVSAPAKILIWRGVKYGPGWNISYLSWNSGVVMPARTPRVAKYHRNQAAGEEAIVYWRLIIPVSKAAMQYQSAFFVAVKISTSQRSNINKLARNGI